MEGQPACRTLSAGRDLIGEECPILWGHAAGRRLQADDGTCGAQVVTSSMRSAGFGATEAMRRVPRGLIRRPRPRRTPRSVSPVRRVPGRLHRGGQAGPRQAEGRSPGCRRPAPEQKNTVRPYPTRNRETSTMQPLLAVLQWTQSHDRADVRGRQASGWRCRVKRVELPHALHTRSSGCWGNEFDRTSAPKHAAHRALLVGKQQCGETRAPVAGCGYVTNIAFQRRASVLRRSASHRHRERSTSVKVVAMEEGSSRPAPGPR